MRRKNHFFEKLWRDFLDLPFGRRLVVGGALLTLLFCFFPWITSGIPTSGSTVNQIDFNAFQKVSFFGVSLTGICFSVFFILFRETFSKRSVIFGISNSAALIGLFSIALYTVLMATFVFQEFAKSAYLDQVGYGIALCFMSIGIGLLGAILSKDFAPKSAERKIFADPKEVDLSKIHLSPETETPQLSLDEYERS